VKRRGKPSKALLAVLDGTWRLTPEQQYAHDAHRLLTALADALNACEAAGYPLKLAHGCVLTGVGYILPVFDQPGERYTVRTMALTEFPAGGHEDED